MLPSVSMIHLLILAVHLLCIIAKLVRPGGVRTVVAESLVLKQPLLISSRSRRRAPNLNSFDRSVLGLGSLFVTPSRIPKLAVILKPRTLFRFHGPRRLVLDDRGSIYKAISRNYKRREMGGLGTHGE